jgi:hypothetical protein
MTCGSVKKSVSLGSLSLRLSEGLSLFNGLGGEVMVMSRYRSVHSLGRYCANTVQGFYCGCDEGEYGEGH